MTDPAFHAPLIHEGILAIHGPDVAKFLQDQLTCSLAYLNDEASSLGGCCSIKGRPLSSFRVLPEGDSLLLATADELFEAQLADLKKYTVFSKVNLASESVVRLRTGLRDASEALRTLGIDTLAGSGGIAHHGNLPATALDDARVELWAPAQRVEMVLATFRRHSREAPLDGWLLGQVRADAGQVFDATRELSIPQTISLQAVSRVNFRKGCYTGQEAVARMQYLGRLKRRLCRLTLDADEVPMPDTELFSLAHSTSVGGVALAVRAPENSVELLAVPQDDAVADSRTSLGSAEGAPLVLPNLPYTLDSDCEIQRRL